MWRFILTSVLIATLYLLSGQVVLAAEIESGGNDPAHPFVPVDGWVTLPAGAHHWYAFRDEGDSTTIAVRLTVLPPASAAFTVLTAEQIHKWERGEEFQAVGAGTPFKLFNNDLYWTGSFVQSGSYYVLVESTGRSESYYKLTITGRQVSFPKVHMPRVEGSPTGSPDDLAVAPESTPLAFSPNITSTVTSSPENPLPPIGKLITITPGEVHWYAFRDEGDESTIQVRADATPDHCLSFQVWTPEELARWRLGGDFRPVGQGTANAALKADLFWTGSFVKSGTYYVVVERDPAVRGPCSYQLTVIGNDVSLMLSPN
ncbi:MAG: hypothetical protein R3C14_09100 [Caldilineaceae bacterium]